VVFILKKVIKNCESMQTRTTTASRSISSVSVGRASTSTESTSTESLVTREFLRRGSRRESKMKIEYPKLSMRRKELPHSKLGFSKPSGWSTLHFAAKEGNVGIIQGLIQRGSGDLVKLRAHTGDTPLHLAVQYNHIEVCEYLLRHHETEVNARNIEQETPLDIAYSNKRRRLIAMLTERGGQTFKFDAAAARRASTIVAL
jgi:ankyrin repeat protein